MATRRKVNLYFGSHKDCFVHGTVKEWTPWIKTTQDGLSIISLTLSDGFKVFATFSNRPALTSSRTRKARHVQPSDYLEIDPDYAKCLGIKEGDVAVVECIPEVTVCVSMSVESNDQDDYEVLEENKERIVFHMLDQVRIISCKRPFAIWINRQPIFLKLVKSEPPATWVLIGNKTYVDIQTPPTDHVNSMLSPSLPTSPLPGRTDSQDSDESGQTGSTASSYFSSLSHQTKNTKVHTSEPSTKGTGSGAKDLYSYSSKRFSQSEAGSIGDALCFPKDNEFPNSSNSGGGGNSEDGGMVTSVLNFLNRSLFHGNSPIEEQNPITSNSQLRQHQAKMPFLTPREEYIRPMKKKASMSKSYTFGTKGKHSKTPSWHGRTEYELEKEQYYIKSLSMPFMLNPIHVRVQELDLEKLKAVWDIHDYNEVFVHPSTLPDLFQASGGGRESYLVSLSFIASNSGVTAASSKDMKGSGSGGHSNTPTPVQPKQKSHLPENPKKDDLGVMQMLTQLTNYEANTPPITITPASNQPPALTRPHSYLTTSVICHLRFATTIRFNNKRRKSASQTLEEVSISREGSSSPTLGGHPSPTRQPRTLGCMTVLPHHIVMSGLIRQQLGVKAGTIVRLAGCQDNWKVNCRNNRVSLYLHPIVQNKTNEGSTSAGFNDMRKKSDIIRAFKNWVSKFEESPYGCVFANNMVIPLNTNLNRSGTSLVSCTSEDVLLCKVTCKVERSSNTPIPVDTPHKIFAITVNDFKKDTKEMINGIEINPVIDKLDETGANAKQLGAGNDFPSLEELTPFKPEESIEHFGGMEELFSTSYRSLVGLLEHNPGGVMLICGIGKGGGVGGCGKTSLSRLLCKELMVSHHKAHVITVSCTLLRGKRYESIQKRFNEILNEVIPCQPAVILLDDLDHCAQNITDVQREATGEGIMHLRTAQVFLDFVNVLRQRAIKAVVIVTATNKDLLHPSLLHSKGKHIFSETIEILPPTLTMRQNILQAILRNAKVISALSDHDLRVICLKTEGYQAIDLKVLMIRAISNAEQQAIMNRIEKQGSKDITNRVQGEGIRATPVQMSVELKDFLNALDSYVPASLSGLSLHKNGNISFSNVGGLAIAKTTLQETLLWPSKYPRLFKSCPIKQHAGVLLYGAPGTGKTLLAGAVANEFGLNFVSIKGPELLNKFIGASEQSVRDLFTRAQSARPCILFFDEFDSLAPRRGHDRTGVTDRVVNQILTQLDGVEALEGVYVLAASSRPDLIDPALLRPGRIDKILLCNMPTEVEREQILKALSKGLPLSLDVDFKEIASMTPAYTGADLKALLYNAQLLQVRRTLEAKETTDTTKLPISVTVQDTSTSNTNSNRTTGPGTAPTGPGTAQTGPGTAPTGPGTAPTDDNKMIHIRDQSDISRNSTTTTSDHSKGNIWQFNYNKQTVGIEKKALKQLSIERLSNHNPANEKGRIRCLVTQEDLLTSLANTKPSLSETEKKKYEKIYEKFLGKSKTTITDLDPRATLA